MVNLSRINDVFSFLNPITDILWEFPRNFEFYKNIPIIGDFSLAILLLMGCGMYFSFKLKFVQVGYFKRGVNILKRRSKAKIGISPMASFLLSSATRIGPGNIMGVTGAVLAGGPGALFWMWVSAFFGMATSFVEATLSQIFKEKNGEDYVGGIAYYGRKLLNNSKIAGFSIAVAYILYALFTLPSQVFHMFTAFGSVASQITGNSYGRTDMIYIVIGISIIVLTTIIIFGGIRRVAAVTDLIVPIMAVLYFGIALFLIAINLDKVPYFFTSVFSQAFSPDAIFGGAMGIALQQGIKRGLMSNEAGQGTVTMAAAAADAKHPVEQGFIQSLGVFIDTFVICTISGFLVIIANVWNLEGFDFMALKSDKLGYFITSLKVLSPQALETPIQFLVSLCYGMFAFSTILGMIAFIEVSATEISRKKVFLNTMKLISSLLFIPFGVACVWSGAELDNIWIISDLTNIMMVYINIPLIIIGFKYTEKALENYNKEFSEIDSNYKFSEELS
ncbi:alanine/glycine:cation symporter family protein [Candidatus Cetobacterium colombiensis]|uniref:Amino acid carrier protein n=1 Tax=Candidatus Cetobacterium colombiensis TaxID=3073100 RepID=A0ABU4W684_9FUSO|nr:amino acid carrier protein [Candidatus Cetobacterium colombiensis]MDX8335009.1 amino acid carrier protein [Candidatus Cetobacterium colombiensis]